MKNLKHETLKALAQNGKPVEDILWIGTDKAVIPIDMFWKLADQNYDDGFGIAWVNMKLKVVGKDWWLERAEYDGSEWWEFKEYPKTPLGITEDILAVFPAP